MTTTYELSPSEELQLKLRNREKSIELLTQEVRNLRNLLNALSPTESKEVIKQLKFENTELKEKLNRIVLFEKGELKNLKKDEYVSRLRTQLKALESKNAKLKKDNDTLIVKYHAQLNRND